MFDKVTEFENAIAKFYGAPYAVATDCCTHAIELCLRLTKPTNVACPKNTYLSLPMTFEKLNIAWKFIDVPWHDYYYITNTNIIDAAVHWEADGFQSGYFNCLSFQFKKHLNVGRGGMILTDDADAAFKLRKMSYDGRLPNIPWAEQNINTIGYHYYMTPETAQLGLDKLEQAKNTVPRKWSYKDYPDISTMKVFNVQ
jgi:dTDP-4-amino-4,6-dideoxygalactose transaminase